MSYEVLLLRFEAPLMSFGAVHVDENGPTDRFPGRSLVTGLLGNALGWHHRDADALQRLQERMRLASRIDRAGDRLVDYHTVDLGHPDLREGWTTWNTPAGREGGKAKEGTHIRYRHYLADAIVTAAVQLDPAAEAPTLADLAGALEFPARPLFLGRKCCLPSGRILLGVVEASSLLEALRRVPLSLRVKGDADAEQLAALPARWPANLESSPQRSREVALYGDRDWTNQIHTGRSLYREGPLGDAQ